MPKKTTRPKKSTTTKRKPARKAPSKRKPTQRKRSVSRVVTATCKKCGTTIKYDIGDHTKEEVLAMLGKQDTFSCPGHHVELSSPLNYIEIDWSSLEKQHVPTDKEWLAKMRKDGYKLISTDELRDKYTVTGFSMGLCVAKRKSDGKEVVLDFTNSPSGKRYYY